MSFLEMVEAEKNSRQNYTESEAPIPGRINIQNTNIVPAKKLKKLVKYFVGNMDSPEDRQFVSDIMTKSLESALTPTEEPGNIIVIREDSSWTKEGFYLIAIKYMEIVELGSDKT